MSKYRFVVQILAVLAALAILAGCSGGSPTVATQDPAIIQATLDQAKTQAAQTVIADVTLNAPVATSTPMPTETPAATNTLAATSTDIPTATLPPTFTAVPPTATRVIVINTNTPVSSATPNTVTCTLSDVIPASGEDYKAGAPFDAGWTIKNSSTTNWAASEYDIRYISGTKMHEGADVRDLPADVAANNTFRLVFDMIAPSGQGRHTETWALARSGTSVCFLSVTIDVVP